MTGTDDGRDCEDPSVTSTRLLGLWLLVPNSRPWLFSLDGGTCLWEDVEASAVGVAVGVASEVSVCLAEDLWVDLAGKKQRAS